MSKFLAILFAYFLIGVDGDPDPDAAADPEADLGEAAGEDGEGEGEAEAGEGEDAGEPAAEPAAEPQGRAAREIARLRERAQAAEREAADLRARAAPAAQPTRAPVDELFQQEEARLRDPQCTDMERWTINSNRTIRQVQQQAQQAAFNSADTADRTAYQSKAMDNPRMRKYAERVEKKLAELRAQGQNAPREGIYLFLLGEDVNKAALKPKPKGSAEAAKPAAGALSAAARGQPARARSDVSARASSSESAKRRARLENQII
jgi:hypothetical protein